MANVDVEQVAAALNVSPRRVQQLVGEGLPRAERGQYDLGRCMAWYIRYLQKAIEKRSVTDGDSITSLTNERVRQARAIADKMDIENARRRGELVRVEVVAEILHGLAATLAGQLDGLPGRLASELAGLNEPSRVRQRLLDETRAVRAGVAEHIGRLARPTSAPRGRRRNSAAAAAKDAGPVGGREQDPSGGKRRARAMEN